MQLGIFVVIGFFGHSKLPWPDHFATLFALPGYSLEKSQFGQQKSMTIMVEMLHFTILGHSVENLPTDWQKTDQSKSILC